MGNMLILESHIENMGLCKLIEEGNNGQWKAITLSGRRINVELLNNKAIEIKESKGKLKKYFM